jgi:soluble lytic murein transglycosylase-like protein
MFDLNAIQNAVGSLLGPKVVSPLPQDLNLSNKNNMSTAQLKSMFSQAYDMLDPKAALKKIAPNPAAPVQAQSVLGAQTAPGVPPYLAKLPKDPGQQYNELIEQAGQQTGVPPTLLKGMLAHESMQFNPKYTGGYHTDGSGRGVAAIDKNAHPEIPDDQAFNPSFAIPWAAKMLKSYYDQEGNWTNALRRYNGGGNYASSQPGYAGVPVTKRTMDYAANVLKQAKTYGTDQASMSAIQN